MFLVLSLLIAITMPPDEPQDDRPRLRDLRVTVGVFEPGPLNAITDVEGVRVGHQTKIEGDRVRTGVTAILPHGGDLFDDKVAGAVFVGNGFGKLAGVTQIRELGAIETPIVLTNTLSVGTAVEAVVGWTLDRPGHDGLQSVNAVVGECNDGRLNAIGERTIDQLDVRKAIDSARSGPVDEGTVGAGTGTVCFGWKGGIGTSSRKLDGRFGDYTVGVLVQTNFGGVLNVGGAPVGKSLGQYAYQLKEDEPEPGSDRPGIEGGSCMIVVATDAPLDGRALERLAARAIFGMGRTGASYTNGSGDYAIAFSTTVRSRHGAREPKTLSVLPPDALSPLFQAALEATEEAILNSILRATTLSGNGSTVEAIPIDDLKRVLDHHRIGARPEATTEPGTP